MLFDRGYELRIGRAFTNSEEKASTLASPQRQRQLIDDFIKSNKQYQQLIVQPGVSLEQILQFEDDERILITDNHITFDVEKTGGDNTTGNEAVITIYNLSDESANLIDRVAGRKNYIELLAGYKSDILKTIFRGNIVKVEDQFEDVNRRTKLTCSDAGVYLQTQLDTRTYPKGTPINKIVTDLLNDLLLPKGVVTRLPESAVTTKPVMIHGRASDQLKRILEIFNYNLHIQDMFVNVTSKDFAVGGRRLDQQSLIADEAAFGIFNDKTIPLINVNTGLVGSPAILSDTSDMSPAETETQSTSGVKFKTLLNGEFIPSGYVKLESNAYLGVYRILKVTHEGSYEGDTWHSTVEAELVTKQAIEDDQIQQQQPLDVEDTDQRKINFLTDRY